VITTASHASGDVKLILVEAEPSLDSLHLLVKVIPKHSSAKSDMGDSDAPHDDGI
jgi:hypothetical protein